MAGLAKPVVGVLVLAVLVLAGCAADDLENAALGSAKAWCKNTSQHCTVHDEDP
jgi:hypothetical protein